MKPCGPDCAGDGICDFCKYYDFNGDRDGVYLGNGQCRHPAHPGRREPYDGCDDYHCFRSTEDPDPPRLASEAAA